MTTSNLSLITPLDAPLPVPRGDKALNECQWVTLLAIADTIIPRLHLSSSDASEGLELPAAQYEVLKDTVSTRNSSDNAEFATKFLEERPSASPEFRAFLERHLSDYLRQDARKGLRVILSALK